MSNNDFLIPGFPSNLRYLAVNPAEEAKNALQLWRAVQTTNLIPAIGNIIKTGGQLLNSIANPNNGSSIVPVGQKIRQELKLKNQTGATSCRIKSFEAAPSSATIKVSDPRNRTRLDIFQRSVFVRAEAEASGKHKGSLPVSTNIELNIQKIDSHQKSSTYYGLPVSTSRSKVMTQPPFVTSDPTDPNVDVNKQRLNPVTVQVRATCVWADLHTQTDYKNHIYWPPSEPK